MDTYVLHDGAELITPPINERFAIGQFSLTFDFFNWTAETITIGNRFGMKFQLSPIQKVNQENALVIRLHFRANQQVKNNIGYQSNKVALNHNLATIYQGFADSTKQNSVGGSDFFVDFKVSPETLKKHGGIVYYKDLDVLIGINQDVIKFPDHPFSEGSYQMTSKQSNKEHTNFGIYIVDNEGIYGDCYINFCGNVIKVESLKNPMSRNGVFISFSKNEGKYTYITFEEAEKSLTLFKTKKEAAAAGDIESRNRKELLELDQKIQLQKKELIEQEAQLSKEKQAFEMKRLALDKDKTEIEHFKTMERLEKESKAEEASYARKNTTETLKFIPTLFVGLASALVAAKTFFSF